MEDHTEEDAMWEHLEFEEVENSELNKEETGCEAELLDKEVRQSEGEEGTVDRFAKEGEGSVEEVGWGLVTDQEVPSYNREVGIVSGYRRPLSYSACLRSVFRIHNETVNIWSPAASEPCGQVNIWTHLLGFFFFLWLLLENCLRHQSHLRDGLDLGAICLQLLSYQVCMMNSAVFHTFICHSKETKQQLLQCDHGGILLAFLGTYVRIIVTTLRCFPGQRSLHLTIVCLLFGTVLAIKYGPGKAGTKVPLGLFYALALYVAVPFAHFYYLSVHANQSYVTPSMMLWLWSPYLVASVGLGFYLTHWPEKLVKKGRVDICGASHQIWHVFIFLAMASWHYLAAWVSRESSPDCQGASSEESLLNLVA